MNEYDNIIQSYTEAGPAQATTALDANPDRATRALQLSRATGVAPLAVYNDLDSVEAEHKANLTANIVRGNSQISQYIRGNALADHVSNDDYGNLDESSRAFSDALDSHPIWGKGVPKRYIAEPLMEGIKGAIYGAAEGFTQEPFKVPENYSALSKGAYDFLGIPLRGLNAVAGGFMGGAGGLARQATLAVGGDTNQANRAEREAKGIVESEMGRGGSGLHQADHAMSQVVRQNEALAVAKPWLDAGVDVPRGVHPLIDEIKVKTNDAWVDKIQAALDQAQNSLTKERDPELFNNFAKQHFEDAQMGISGDRIAALYGDKLPEPGDGLLGWVPGIAEKLEAAKTFGEDVHVPLAEWVTYMDPQLARELKDDIRAWPGGITKTEAAAKDFAAPAIDGAKETLSAKSKETVPEIEPITLDQRLDAYRNEYRNMLEDATFDEKGFRISGLRDAIDVVSSAFGVTGDRGREALALAISHDRPDIAEALVQRAERSAQTSNTTPGVAETSPKYNEIKKNLERLKKEAEDYAAELREQLNEAKLKNSTMLDGALSQVRTSAALEPMFAIGDRKLELKRESETNPFQGMDPKELAKSDGLVWEDMSRYEQQRYLDAVNGSNQRQHSWQFHDEKGNVVGQLLINPDAAAKQLYVDWVGGLGKFGPSSFGPSLIRDIKRQLKEAYPEFETIAGHRVSGARYSDKIIESYAKDLAHKEGVKWDKLDPSEMADYMAEAHESYTNLTDRVTVKLALGDAFEMSKEYTDLRNILDTAPTKFGDVTADLKPTELYTKHEQAIGQAVQEEINRITGKTAEPVLASDIRYEGIDGIRGVYHKAPGEVAKILVSLGDFDATGIARHEAIHHLYREGFFKPEEWNALIDASKTEGWRERYSIDSRYEHLNELGLHEEAIAEAFRDWAKTREQQPINPVTTVFQKIWNLMQRIKDRVAKMLGREPSFNELFEQAFTGELAQRGQGEVRPGDAFAKGEVENQLRAEAAGLDAKSFKKIQDLIQKRYQEDISAAVKRAEQEQRTIQSKEWKEQAREVRKESEADVRARPDVQADLLIGSGELGGKKLERNRYELRAEDLSPEQKAALPRHYYSKEGVPVDVMANLFGYSDGNHLIEALAEVNKGKEGRSAQENLKRLVDEETNRRMEEKYGKLQENIMLDAMDQALSETNLQILSEEWQGAAMAAGVKVVDKNIAKEEALRMFGDMKLADVNVERLLGIMGKIGRDTERLLIAGKNAEALVQMQRKYQTALIAAEARKLQKEQATFERTAKQFSKREVSSVDPEYTNYVHQILMQIGKPVRRSIQDLQAQIEGHGSKNLQEFVGEKAASLREIPVWDQLFDTNWSKSYDSLTTTEFRAIHDSIKALAHNGRDELKIMKQGEAEDLAVVKQQMIQNVIEAAGDKFAEQNKGPIKKILMNYYVGHLQMENIFNRWDKFDSKGVWNQYIMRDLIDGANQKDAWLKEYAAKLKQLPEPEGLVRSIDNPLFKDQDTGATLPLTRKNLIAVMLNTGNSSNLAKLAKGYKIEPNDVMSWVHQHATKRDWEFVQGVWDMFSDIKFKADTMYRSLTGGVAPENIAIRPVDTPHGQFKGGYYPIIYHAEMEGKSKTLMGRDPLEQDNFVRATTPAGYTKTRTGYAAPMALELDAMPGRIGQMLHDIALRPAVLNAAKVFYDHDVRSAIRAHFGAEYRDELVPYLRGVANASNYESKAQTVMNQASEFIRQNMITTLVGLNPGTVMKHGPTAAVLSIREVGAEPMAKAVRGLFSVNEATGDSNWHFAIQNSLELQRRDRNWAETLYGSATGVLAPGDKLTPWRQKIMEWSSKPVALSDMISAVPTWLAKYEGERANGATHGDAVYEADRAVRRAHGSTAITTRTAMMRNANPWMVSIYNFFSDVMNRQMETVWKAGETKDLVKKGEWGAAAKTVPALTASLFAYAIWPAIVETYVSPHPHKDDDSWVKKSAVSMGFALGSSWVGVRDIASAMAMGRDPQFGLTGTAYQTMVNTFKDLAKNEPFNKEHAGKILQDAGIMVGGLTGMLPAQVSKAGRFMFDVSTGKENPRNTWQWLTGLRYGTTEKHPQNFTDYMKGKH